MVILNGHFNCIRGNQGFSIAVKSLMGFVKTVDFYLYVSIFFNKGCKKFNAHNLTHEIIFIIAE